MSMAIRLFGKPGIERDGTPAATPARAQDVGAPGVPASERESTATQPCGRRCCSRRPTTRWAPLRWTLADLRRTLGQTGAVTGAPGRAGAPHRDRGRRVGPNQPRPKAPRSRFPRATCSRACRFPSSPVFESWLAVTRRYLDGAARALAARRGAGPAHRRVTPTVRSSLPPDLVSQDPLDQTGQELDPLPSRAGRGSAAQAQLRECEVLLRREAGREPGTRRAERCRGGRRHRGGSDRRPRCCSGPSPAGRDRPALMRRR